MDSSDPAATSSWPRTWTFQIALAGRGGGSPEADNAWRYLVEQYRAPIQRSLQRHLRGHPDAWQANDEFFTYLLTSSTLPRFDRAQGRFRCFLQGILRHFAQSWLRERSKRSAFDVDELEPQAIEDEAAMIAAEESEWASGVLTNACARFEREAPEDAELLYRSYGIPPFEVLERDALAAHSGRTVNALNVAVFRARKRLKQLLLDELSEQVSSPRDFEDEQRVILERLLTQRPRLMRDLLQSDTAT